jgi:hypothetical protein
MSPNAQIAVLAFKAFAGHVAAYAGADASEAVRANASENGWTRMAHSLNQPTIGHSKGHERECQLTGEA